MLKKKSKLNYRFSDESRNTKDIAEELIKTILVKAKPTSSCWWSKMKVRSDDFKNNVDLIAKQQIAWLKGNDKEPNTKEGGATIKTCPGILGLFKQTILVTSPTEIIISINKHGEYYYNIADESIMTISGHDQEQFYQENNTLFKDKISLKFEIAVKLNTSDFGYMLTDPTYHNNSGCFIPMGIINEKYGKKQELNLISFIDIPKDKETTIVIKAGDVLAYLIPFKDCDIEFTEKNFVLKRLQNCFQPKHVY
jgi:hypothetical protein